MTTPSNIADKLTILDALIAAARPSSMPAGEQLRFENMLNQMAGRVPRKDPLPNVSESVRNHLQRMEEGDA